MDRRVTPPKRVTSPAWGPPPPCKQALRCWPYLLYRSVDYGKRAWRLFGIVFKQIRAQKRAAPGCFGFTGAKAGLVCGRSFHEFWEVFNLPVVHGSETQTKRKECSISCIAIADVINDQVEAMDFKTILYQNINYLLNCNYQLSTLCRVIRFLLHLPLVFL